MSCRARLGPGALCSLAYDFHFSTLGPAGKICSPSTQKNLVLGQPVRLREKVGRPSCFRSSQYSKPPSDSLVQETKTQRGSVTCLKSHSKLVEESELENRAPDNERVVNQRVHGCHSWPGWGSVTAHTLDASGFFSGPNANSCCSRPEQLTLVLSSLSCCLRIAKTKAKQAREPVLKKNWRPTNLGKSKGYLSSGLHC